MNGANEIYAIKRVSLDRTDAETMNGYMNEISLLKRLEGNSRIIKLIDSELKAGPGGSKGHLMLVMECGEIDLARLLQEQQREPLDLVWVSYYWKQMLQAVHVIHEEKIVHSDLKPANFVLVKGQLKLIDFGIANAIANDTTNIQRDHQIGTVNYMSPEAIELPEGMRRLKVGRQSDIWSLGCILYQMVYGHPPFQHLASVFAKMKAIPDGTYKIKFPAFSTPSVSRMGSSSPPRKLDHLKVAVPQNVINTIKSCLIRNPKERATIPDLLQENWLTMRQPESTLKPDETVINPHFMAQLLSYGITLGRAENPMQGEDLLREGERLIAELQSVIAQSAQAENENAENEENAENNEENEERVDEPES
ncbi:kinase-like domain-containing protein [Abortiporus biennis]|nr:kinase-like domain-containing protein [Abortiporus biennis]